MSEGVLQFNTLRCVNLTKRVLQISHPVDLNPNVHEHVRSCVRARDGNDCRQIAFIALEELKVVPVLWSWTQEGGIGPSRRSARDCLTVSPLHTNRIHISKRGRHLFRSRAYVWGWKRLHLLHDESPANENKTTACIGVREKICVWHCRGPATLSARLPSATVPTLVAFPFNFINSKKATSRLRPRCSKCFG